MNDLPPKTPPAPPVKNKVGFWRLLGRSLSVLIVMGVLAPILGVASLFAPGPLAQDKTVIIPHGTSVIGMGSALSQEGAIYTAPLFMLAARIVASNSLKAGEYAIPAHASAIDIALMMHEGKSVVRKFTVAEGLTSATIVNLLNQDPTFSGTVDARPAEGSLLPETYRYSYGDTRASMITRMQKSMQEKLNELWASRDADAAVTSPENAVILASVVEKETGKADERPRIAGVFYNRLRLNMRLQSDPTVIYALTKGADDLGRPLTHDDLALASPINTYASDGLPPQPICNPGRAALEAVLHPEHNNFLYFVADGSGGHAFAADLAAHNENINRWHQWLENHK